MFETFKLMRYRQEYHNIVRKTLNMHVDVFQPSSETITIPQQFLKDPFITKYFSSDIDILNKIAKKTTILQIVHEEILNIVVPTKILAIRNKCLNL